MPTSTARFSTLEFRPRRVGEREACGFYFIFNLSLSLSLSPVSYTHLRAHETA